MWAYHKKRTKTQLRWQTTSDDTRLDFDTASQRSQPGRRCNTRSRRSWLAGNDSRRASAADRRSHGSYDPAHSPDLLEYCWSVTRAFRTGRRAPVTRPLRHTVEPRSTNRWDGTTAGSNTSVTRTPRVLTRPSWHRTNDPRRNIQYDDSNDVEYLERLEWPRADHAATIYTQPVTVMLDRPLGTAVQASRHGLIT